MHGIFHDQIGKDLAAYLDDLLMYALRHVERLPILNRTLGQLIDAGLKCKPRKCQVFPDSIQYLGHIIKDGKIGAVRSKLDKIREWVEEARRVCRVLLRQDQGMESRTWKL